LISVTEEGGNEQTRRDVDPEQFLRALLQINPEDAEKVREATPGTRKRSEPQAGPQRDYGDQDSSP
jgi:hypothetical protein